MVCMDDKSKVDFGEPGMAVSSGVRGKKSIVPTISTLGALDHDVGSKGSLTPSVVLKVDVPELPSESFYRGQVLVTLKDSVFQPSTPFRHAVELMKIARQVEDGADPKPFLLMYTDGGPDHRTTYAAVKLSLIILFKMLDLDVLIAARTAPGHSWGNPAERIMSMLNLAYQNVAIHRHEMSAGQEQQLRSCGPMIEIRKKAEKEPAIKPAWIESLQPMVNLLNERTERVQLKGKNFISGKPASDDDVQAFEHKVVELLDPDIPIGNYTKQALKKCEAFHDYISKHCRERNYIFQVRKCDVTTCCRPIRNPTGVLPPFLPDPVINVLDRDHYQAFDDVLGTETTEKDMPSGQVATGCQNRMLVAQNVRLTVTCQECEKPRCIYAKKALSQREARALRRLMEKYIYTYLLQGVVFVRLQLCCGSPVEMAYYASNLCRNDTFTAERLKTRLGMKLPSRPIA
ncbi:hypothetical protein MAR_019123 [Mya arenaria]|uniref:Uncharacterized protein n=1 Tax=Mya arenaria TaxID=6604 RepID=A0ABY7EH22_MYAAR|nr:hypothetical protein MAR_019123 [Mya arenaria]